MLINQNAAASVGNYLGNVTLGGVNMEIGYEKKFRWRWFASQLNTFVFVAETNELITAQAIQALSQMCFNFAEGNNKGWPKGLQSAIASILIVKGSNIDPSAKVYCETTLHKHWAAFELTALLDTSTRQSFYHKSKVLWGAAFFPYLRKKIEIALSNLEV